MHITLETDYAIRIVDRIAREKGRLDAKRISEDTNVPLRFSLKILRKLVTGEIIVSYKGVHGGYELNRPINEISLYDIVEIVEGTYRFSRCLDEEYECNCGNKEHLSCSYQVAFKHITDIVQKELKNFTLDKFINEE